MEHKKELDRLNSIREDYPKPHFLADWIPYYWVIKHPDYNPANYGERLCRSKMKEKPIFQSNIF